MPARLCKTCVLPEVLPHLLLNDESICPLCVEHQKKQKSQKLLESDFIRIIDKQRGRRRYDCLVMCSGGKDSTAALYFMKTRYKLNPLAFTFDHGFETAEALENVHRAVEKLDVDFLFFKTPYMKKMFKRLIESKSKAVICHPCSIWYMQTAFEMAARFDTGLIIAGWTKGQSVKQEVLSACGCNVHQPEYKAMAQATREFMDTGLKGLPEYQDFPRSMEELLKRVKKKQKTLVLSPHWFLPYSTEEYVKIIQDELGWQYPKKSYPLKSTNCSLNFVSVHNSMRDFGYTHYHVEMSKLVREGLISREEALQSLRTDFDDSLLSGILKELGLAMEAIR